MNHNEAADLLQAARTAGFRFYTRANQLMIGPFPIDPEWAKAFREARTELFDLLLLEEHPFSEET
jgi:hypothetical protein